MYLKFKKYEKDVAADILSRTYISDILSDKSIEIKVLGSDDCLSLSRSILSCDNITDDLYAKYIKCLPYYFKTFPTDISNTKHQCLAKMGTIRLTDDSFAFAREDELLLSFLIISNIDEYITNKEKYQITDTLREKILSTEISYNYRINICKDVTKSGAISSKKLSRFVADVLLLPEVDCSTFDQEIIFSAINNAKNIDDKIKIITKCISFWDIKITMSVLEKLPEPFNFISVNGNRPRIPNTSTNIKFANILQDKHFVSSINIDKKLIKINTRRRN